MLITTFFLVTHHIRGELSFSGVVALGLMASNTFGWIYKYSTCVVIQFRPMIWQILCIVDPYK